LKAAHLFEKGYTQAQVRSKLGGTPAAASQWYKRWEQGGVDALRSTGTPGPAPSLADADREQLCEDLRAGAREHGFPTEVWTLPRIAAHIRYRFAVDLSESRVGEILHELGFSKQKPERRSRERDDERIAVWKRTTWPAVKKRGSMRRHTSGSSTNAG
jgi:transposase